MGRIVAIALLFFISLTSGFAATTLSCSTTAAFGDVTINEIYSVSGNPKKQYVELYFNKRINVNNWRVKVFFNGNANPDIDISNVCAFGAGSLTYPDGSTGTTDGVSCMFNKGTFLSFERTTGDNLNTNNIEAVLLDSSGKVVDYFEGGSSPSNYTVPSACTTAVNFDGSGSISDISRLTDGGSTIYDLTPTGGYIVPTEGGTNMGGGNASSTKTNLSVSKSAYKDGLPITSAYVGDTITYRITAQNTGSYTAAGVDINDTLPSNLSIQSCSALWDVGITNLSMTPQTCVPGSQTVDWHGFNVNRGDMVELNITAVVTAEGNSVVNLVDANMSNAYQTRYSASSTLNFLMPPPIAEYRFDECKYSGTVGEIKDSKGLNNGTSKALSGNTGLATTVDGGVVNKMVEFKGEGYNANPYNTWYQAHYYAEVPDADVLSPLSLLQNGKMTITGWFKLNNTSDTHTIVHKGGSGVLANQEYRVYVEGGKLNFTVWDSWDSPKTITVNQNVVANTYYFFAVTARIDAFVLDTLNMSAYLKTSSATYTQTGASSLYTYNALKDSKLYFGATNWGGSNIANFLNGFMDEIKLYDKELSSYVINRIYANESAGKNYDGTTRAAINCSGVNSDYIFGVWDSSIVGSPPAAANRRLYTKVVGTPFSLAFAQLNTVGDTIQSSSSTVTASVVDSATQVSYGSSQSIVFDGSANPKNVTFNVPSAIKSAQIKVVDSNASAVKCTATSPCYSEDLFSVRPAYFLLSASSIKAGEDINVSVGGGGGYGGSAIVSTSLKNANASCSVSNKFLSATDPATISFAADKNTGSLVGQDVGTINVNIADTSWTAVDRTGDCDMGITDGGVSNSKAGCDINTTIVLNINPYQLTTAKNSFITTTSSVSPYWSYLDSSRTQYVEVNSTVKAYAKDGITISKNFSDGCIGSSVPLGFYFTGTASGNANISLSSITGSTATSIKDENSSYSGVVNNQYFSVPNSSFKDGVSSLSLKFNLARDSSNPIDPFSLTLTDIKSSYGVVNSGVIDNNATASDTVAMLYGRIAAPNAISDYMPSLSVRVYAQVYAASLASLPGTGWVQAPGSSSWWINSKDSTSSISSIYVRKGDVLALSNDGGSIGSSAYVTSGIAPMTLSGFSNNDQKLKIHMNAPSYLWYGSNAYNFAVGSDCTQHPCMSIDIFGTQADGAWYGSGTKEDRTIKSVPKGKRAPKVNW